MNNQKIFNARIPSTVKVRTIDGMKTLKEINRMTFDGIGFECAEDGIKDIKVNFFSKILSPKKITALNENPVIVMKAGSKKVMLQPAAGLLVCTGNELAPVCEIKKGEELLVYDERRRTYVQQRLEEIYFLSKEDRECVFPDIEEKFSKRFIYTMGSAILNGFMFAGKGIVNKKIV